MALGPGARLGPYEIQAALGAAAKEINVVVNWLEELKRLVPAN